VVVIAPAPNLGMASRDEPLRDAVTRLRKRGVRVRWAAVDPVLGLEAPKGAEVVTTAIEVEMGIARRAALAKLSATIGVRLVEARSLAARHPSRRYEDVAEARPDAPREALGAAGDGAE
jgi:hypothetical protein